MKAIWIVLLLFFISACDSSIADKTSKNRSDEKGIHTEHLSPTVSFDTHQNHLESDFKKHDIEDVGKFLVENAHLFRMPYKDEFETTDDFKKRVEKIDPTKELFKTKDGQHYFAFSFDQPRIAVEYNADIKELGIKFKISSFNYSLTKKIVLNSTHSEATNVFGRKIDVENTDEVEYVLRVS